MEQAPPKGWTGRRLRPSQGYFAVSGREIRARARLWLAEHREGQQQHPRPFGEPQAGRLVWGTPEWEKAARAAVADPGTPYGDLPLPARVASDRGLAARLADPDAPVNVDHLSAEAQDENANARRVRAHYRRRWRESVDRYYAERLQGSEQG